MSGNETNLLPPDEAWVEPAASQQTDLVAASVLRDRLGRRQWLMLCISALVVLMALILQVRPDDRVQFRWGPDWPLPESCFSKVYLGMECPGCGLTRSFIHLSRGRIWDAWGLNRASWLLGLAVLGQIPYRCWLLSRLKQDRLPNLYWPQWIGWGLVAVLFGNWLLKAVGI